MDEYVLAVFASQKSKTLGVVKPLDCACFHCVLLLLTDLPRTQCGSLRVGGNRNRQELQIEFYDCIECSTDLNALREISGFGWRGIRYHRHQYAIIDRKSTRLNSSHL